MLYPLEGKMQINDQEDLRALYGEASPRVQQKELRALDVHCRKFIELSPFLVLASGDAERGLDASPRGGAPGFVKVLDAHTLLIPDAAGNKLVDSLSNLVANPQLGLLFMIPGIEETLRVNGRAKLSLDAHLLSHFADLPRPPKLVIALHVQQAFLHCAKAIMRSELWSPAVQQPRSVLPTMAEMINDHSGIVAEPMTQEEMRARFRHSL